jgi:hypothetical protein
MTEVIQGLESMRPWVQVPVLSKKKPLKTFGDYSYHHVTTLFCLINHVFPHSPCIHIIQLFLHCKMQQDLSGIYTFDTMVEVEHKWHSQRWFCARSKNFEKYLPSGLLIISNYNAAQLQWASGTFENCERFIFENNKKNGGLLNYHIEKKSIPIFLLLYCLKAAVNLYLG